ncbi:MAG: hypothetical protein ACKO63_02405 [Nodosilinea sp.]
MAQKSDIERVRELANRLLKRSRSGDKKALDRVEHYMLRLESQQSTKLAKRDAAPILEPCTRLKDYRLKLGLTQPSLALLANIYSVLAEQGYSYAEITAHLHSLKNHRARLDVTHLSKFERGTLIPWDRAQVLLAEVFSILTDAPIAQEELFPEPCCEPKHKAKNQHLTRAAIEQARDELIWSLSLK